MDTPHLIDLETAATRLAVIVGVCIAVGVNINTWLLK